MSTINSLPEQSFIAGSKLDKIYQNLKNLINVLQERSLPQDIAEEINQIISEKVNFSIDEKSLKKQLRSTYKAIIDLLRNKLNIVPKSYYRNMWMALGMTVFGMPIGVAISTAIGNIAMLGAFLPIGMAIGLAVGSTMDKKAADEGRQLDITYSL